MKIKVFLAVLLLLPIFFMVAATKIPRWPDKPVVIQARAVTEGVRTAGDAADDSVIYINEDDPKKSLIIGTDKQSGVSVYDLSGKRIQEFLDGELNNIDIRYGFKWKNRSFALVSAGNRSTNSIDLYLVDKKTNKLEKLPDGTYPTSLEIYGSCMYKNLEKNQIYIFANSKEGDVIQYKVVNQEDKAPTLEVVRTFNVGSQVEGCVADDLYERFYIGEEKVGIWQYGANPQDKEERMLIDSTGVDGNLVADVEGLTLYRTNKHGYLLASSQGEDAYTIYSRKTGVYIGKFQVEYNGLLVRNTDGIEASSHYLGKKYPNGLVVVQDGNSTYERQSFKLISWQDLALSFSPPLRMGNRDSIIERDDDD